MNCPSRPKEFVIIKTLNQIATIETKGKSSGYPRGIFQIFS